MKKADVLFGENCMKYCVKLKPSAQMVQGITQRSAHKAEQSCGINSAGESRIPAQRDT